MRDWGSELRGLKYDNGRGCGGTECGVTSAARRIESVSREGTLTECGGIELTVTGSLGCIPIAWQTATVRRVPLCGLADCMTLPGQLRWATEGTRGRVEAQRGGTGRAESGHSPPTLTVTASG